MSDGRNTARGTSSESTAKRTHRRLIRARARIAAQARRHHEQELIAFADPFFVDPFCLLSPR